MQINAEPGTNLLYDTEKLPAHLYRYRSMDSRGLREVFEQNILKCTSPVAFNDPFDSHVNLTVDGNPEQILEMIRKQLQEHLTGLDHASTLQDVKKDLHEGNRRMLEKVVKEMHAQFAAASGVLSFSEISDDILMWAHYAGSHSGICFEFKSDRNQVLFKYAHKVIYQKDYPQISFFLGSTEEYVNVLLTKSDHWSYEREWRVVVQNAANEEIPFIPESLTGVIFGHRVSEENIKKIQSWIALGKCRPVLYMAHPKQRSFGLDIVRI